MINDEKILEAIGLLKDHFGEEAETILATAGIKPLTERVGKKLTSFMAFPERGEGGSSSWGGNCSPEVVRSLINYCIDWAKYYRKPVKNFTILDPMGGSGTTAQVGKQMGIDVVSYDLNPKFKHGKANWNALKDEVEDSADLIFFHPPYHDMIVYSGRVWGKDTKPHPDDLSRCVNYNDYIEKLNFVIRKLYHGLRKNGRLAVLVGDYRKKGEFYSIQNDMIKIGKYESFIVKGQYNCKSDNKRYRSPFIPIVTEYLLLFQKEDCFIVPVTTTKTVLEDIRKKDDPTVTWRTLVRSTIESMGGKCHLRDLYIALRNHPKARKNTNYAARIRATLYENPNDYVRLGNGYFQLKYMAC